MRAALLLLAFAAPVLAQNTEVQRSLIQRQQATDAFNLQMRQSQETIGARPENRGALEMRQFSDRQRLDSQNEQQLREVQAQQTPPALQPYERQKLDMERTPFRGPVVEVPVRPAPRAEPLPQGDAIRLQQPKN
jgi:hypothetical protein